MIQTLREWWVLNAVGMPPNAAVLHYSLPCYEYLLGDLEVARACLAHAFKIEAKLRLAALRRFEPAGVVGFAVRWAETLTAALLRIDWSYLGPVSALIGALELPLGLEPPVVDFWFPVIPPVPPGESRGAGLAGGGASAGRGSR